MHITAFGNRLIITSEDAEAVAQVQALVRLLMSTEKGSGRLEVIRLHNANAMEVSKVIDEMFNGKPQGGPGGRGQGGGGFGGGGGGFNPLSIITGGLGGGGGNARVENIRVVADATTNSLLVKAKPLDMLTIRRLVRDTFDVRDKENEFKAQNNFIAAQVYLGHRRREHHLDGLCREHGGRANKPTLAACRASASRAARVRSTPPERRGRPCFASAWT